jgi:hypothetical protein
VRRFLDVLFQHLRWLALSLLAVPLILGAAGFTLDNSHVVTARVRVDPAGFVGDALSDVLSPQNTPAQSAAALIIQLVQTDWFSVRLLAAGGPMAAAEPSEERRAELVDLKTRLHVFAEGKSIVWLGYATDRPERGVALVAALVETVGDALQTIESQKAAAALQVASGELARAREDMQRSIDEASRYAYTADQSGDALQRDPVYRRLLAIVGVTTDHYQELSTLTNQARVVSGEVPGVRGQLAVVVDAPRMEPSARAATAARYWLLGLAGALPIGVLLIYVIALHDPRLRVLDDVRERIPAACLFRIPTVGRRPPPE